MPVVIEHTGVSPLGALLGLALIVAVPLMLVATRLTVGDRTIVVETASDPVAEWYIPAPGTVAIDHRAGPPHGMIRTPRTRGRTALD